MARSLTGLGDFLDLLTGPRSFALLLIRLSSRSCCRGSGLGYELDCLLTPNAPTRLLITLSLNFRVLLGEVGA